MVSPPGPPPPVVGLVGTSLVLVSEENVGPGVAAEVGPVAGMVNPGPESPAPTQM